VILNNTLRIYSGDLALSAIGIVSSTATLLFMPILGISQGAQPIIGFNYGAKNYQRVKATWQTAALAGTAVAVVGFIAIRLWPAQLVGLFSKGDLALTALTTHAMSIFLLLIPVLGFQVVSSTYFQAVGKARQAAILSLSRQVLFFIPLLLILPRLWGVEGVWRTGPLADFLSVTLTAVLMYYEMKSISGDEIRPETGGRMAQHAAPE